MRCYASWRRCDRGRRTRSRRSRTSFAIADLRWLELAWTGSILGQWAYLVAVSVFAFQVGGETAVGLLLLFRLVPAGLLAPFAGMLADRYRREQVLLWTNVTRVLLIGAAAIAVLRGQRADGRLRAVGPGGNRDDALQVRASRTDSLARTYAVGVDCCERGCEHDRESRCIRRTRSRRIAARRREHGIGLRGYRRLRRSVDASSSSSSTPGSRRLAAKCKLRPSRRRPSRDSVRSDTTRRCAFSSDSSRLRRSSQARLRSSSS